MKFEDRRFSPNHHETIVDNGQRIAEAQTILSFLPDETIYTIWDIIRQVEHNGNTTLTPEAKKQIDIINTQSRDGAEDPNLEPQRYAIKILDFLKQTLPPDLLEPVVKLSTEIRDKTRKAISKDSKWTSDNKTEFFKTHVQPSLDAAKQRFIEEMQSEIDLIIQDRWKHIEIEEDTKVTDELPAVDFQPPGTPVNINKEQ